MLTFFLCFRSELATKVHVALHQIFYQGSQICFQNVHFQRTIRRKQNFTAKEKIFLSLDRVDFAVRVRCGIVRISSKAVQFFRTYHFVMVIGLSGVQFAL